MTSDINLQTFALPHDLSEAVEAALNNWHATDKVRKLWARDPSLWTNSDEDKWLGWLDIVAEQQRNVRRFTNFAAEVKDAWSNRRYPASVDNNPVESGLGNPPAVVADSEIALLEQFKIFDMDPGLGTTTIPSSRPSQSYLQSFLQNFPNSLPALAPTLAHLTDLVVDPLAQHCQEVCSSLLAIFLSPASYFDLYTHLSLLRSYLLLASPAFQLRLQAALFSDSDDWNVSQESARTIAKQSYLRQKPSSAPVNTPVMPWAVGLGLGLTERDSWPPGGADLSFYLRTVIVDSLERSFTPNLADADDATEDAGRSRIITEAEFRLGFAIRDLPAGTGREKWLNPCCKSAITALIRKLSQISYSF